MTTDETATLLPGMIAVDAWTDLPVTIVAGAQGGGYVTVGSLGYDTVVIRRTDLLNVGEGDLPEYREDENPDQIKCCNTWIDYPVRGQSTACPECKSVFTLA